MAVVAPEAGVDPALEGDDQDGLAQDGLLVDLEDLGQPVALGAHGAVSSDSAAISKSRADLRREAVDAALVAGAGAGDVAGVDALEDAGQLPVAEGHVVADARDVEVGDRVVALQHLGPGREARAPWSATARARPSASSGSAQ